MPQPPSSPVLSRELIRFIPFATQKTFVQALGAGAALTVEYDVARIVTDRNQLLAGAFPGGAQPASAVGPFLDALWFSPQNGTIEVDYAVDQGAAYRQISLTNVLAAIPGNISGLRITGRFVRVIFTNTAGVPAAVEFGVYIRST